MNVPSPAPQQQRQRPSADHLNVRATGAPAPGTCSALLERLAIVSAVSVPSSPPPRPPVTMVCTPRPRPASTPDKDNTINDIHSSPDYYPNSSEIVQQHFTDFKSLAAIDGGSSSTISANRTTYWDNCYNQNVDLSESSPEYAIYTSVEQQPLSPSFMLCGGSTIVRNQNQNLLARLSPRLSHLDNYLLLQHIDHLAKSSLSLDQGYHTLVPSSGGCAETNTGTMSPTPSARDPPPPPPSVATSKKKCHQHPHHEPALHHQQQSQQRQRQHVTHNLFERLSDALLTRIFQHLTSQELSICARVCRRWDGVVWRAPATSPSLWRSLTLTGDWVNGDRAIRGVLRQLCGQGRTGACPAVERVQVRDGASLTDRGVTLLARRCPALRNVQMHGATAVSNAAVFELVTRCTYLQHLDVTGCVQISCIGANFGPSDNIRRLQLQYLDLTDCAALQDSGLRVIVRNCPQLAYLYLRRCVLITDAGFKYIPSFCSGLRELSVSDCANITDFGLYELAKLGATLRYLSVAKCDQVSDAGLKVVAKRCYKLRYVNVRGCEAVSDDAITVLARCCTRLRALDIGKCDVSDAGLRALAESCPNLKKLSLRNCDLVTDRGVQCVSYYCRGLQQLNIQDCQISLEGYRAVKKYCKRCVIEHTNPGFF